MPVDGNDSTRREYEMTKEQLDKLLDASKPTLAMWGSGGVPFGGTPQENANAAWKRLGREMGFRWDTVRPVPGKENVFFTAEPIEPTETIRPREIATRTGKAHLSSSRAPYQDSIEDACAEIEALRELRDELADALAFYGEVVRLLPAGHIPQELVPKFAEAERDRSEALRKAGRRL